MSCYELAILGTISDDDRARLTTTLAKMLADFDLHLGTEVMIRDGASLHEHDAAQVVRLLVGSLLWRLQGVSEPPFALPTFPAWRRKTSSTRR